MRKLVTISIKILKMRDSSEKETSEENDDIEEKENEDQDFLICVESEKVYRTIWEV